MVTANVKSDCNSKPRIRRIQIVTKSKKRILIVEDHILSVKLWKEVLGIHFDCLIAYDIASAETFFQSSQPFDLIVMDCCCPGNQPNTMDLVRKIRQIFQGPIVANSSNPDYTKQLIAAGASHECEKFLVPSTVVRILGIG